MDSLTIGSDGRELERVFLSNNNVDNKLEQFYLIPYNHSKLTFFLFIRTDDDATTFDLSQDASSQPMTSEAANTSYPPSSTFKGLEAPMLKSIDEILGKQMVPLLAEITEPRKKPVR